MTSYSVLLRCWRTHKEALATLISRETSKPLSETRTEVQAMIGKAAISIEAYHQRTGFHESTLPDGKALCCATNRTA
ncbi:hypothetical protein MJ588_13275 [Klebsiella pneumoniae]|nr:hypothetical protein MJ588_13275 [Klebsiella pneumoniae]